MIELDDQYPTPGRGRNIGLFVATAAFVQFMEADTLRKVIPCRTTCLGSVLVNQTVFLIPATRFAIITTTLLPSTRHTF